MALVESLSSSAPALSATGRSDAASRGRTVTGLTVHMVGRITTPVLSFLLPSLNAMHAEGTPQALLYVNDESAQQVVAALPAAVTLVPVPDSSATGRARGLRAALSSLAKRNPIAVLHLHGLLPGMAAAPWLRSSADPKLAVFFSPHGSHALSHIGVLRTASAMLLRLVLGGAGRHTIVNLRPEAAQMAPYGRMPVQLIESPVPQVFFDTARNEARRPLLVSCNLVGLRAAVDKFARIAVLLNDDKLGISFNWVGDAEPEAAAALKAANVGQFAVASDSSRAQRLSTAWIYVAPTEEPGFPVRLAEAMAAGLPCVALDTLAHRSLIDDGVTGYVCTDLRTMLQRIAELVDSSGLRQAQGAKARQAAVQRFSESVFRDKLMDTVGRSAGIGSKP